MKITLLETAPAFRKERVRKKNDLLTIYREFKKSDAPCAKVEWTEMEYIDAEHCYRSLSSAFCQQNAVCKQKIKVKKKGNDIYLIKA